MASNTYGRGWEDVIEHQSDAADYVLVRSEKVDGDGFYRWAVSVWPGNGRPVHRTFTGDGAQVLAEDFLTAMDLSIWEDAE